MPDFIWKAKDKFGRSVTRQLAAQSVEQAKESLVYQGYTDLQLIHDEYSHSALRKDATRLEVFGEQHVITAEAFVEGEQKNMSTLWGVVVDTFKEEPRLFCMLLLTVTCAYFSHHPIIAAIALLAMPAFVLFRIWIALPILLYDKLLNATFWCRWDEVLRRAETLRKLQRFHPAKYFPEHEFPRLRANALAGKGQLDAALVEMQDLERSPECEIWIYYSELAAIYELAKQDDRAIEFTLKAILEKPLPTFQLMLASRYLRLKKDPVRSRAALEQIDRDTLLQAHRPLYHLVSGMIEFREGNFPRAREEIETALALQSDSRSAVSDPLSKAMKGALCRVLARQGELASAARYFEEAEDFLIASNDTEALHECRQLLGRA